MKRAKYLIFAAIVVLVAFGIQSVQIKAEDAPKKDGKTIFMDAKCANCHAVKSQAIEAKKKDDKTPDLSNIGSELKADFIKKYLKKEEAVHEKKHLIAFKGEDADLDILAAWLETLVEKK